MNQPKTVLGLVITDGVGVRNFIRGRFISVALEKFERIQIYSGVSLEAYSDITKDPRISIIALDIYKESRMASFWRKTAELSHLFRFKTAAMSEIIRMSKLTGFSLFAIRTRFSFILAKLFALLQLQNLAGLIHEYYVSKNPLTDRYKVMIRTNQPDILFFTHQRPPQVAPLAIASKICKVPAVSYIFSWDNLSSKGRMPVLFDKFIVWSQRMKDELLKYYPTIVADSVFICGTPQFETYAYDEFGHERSEFLSQLGLDPNLNYKIICFSCGDVSTSPNDSVYIHNLATAVFNGKFGHDVVLLVRTSPAEGPERFSELKIRFPKIIWNYPEWPQMNPVHPEPWSQRIPSASDIHFLKSILNYSDVSVNMCSTMSLDFALWDKPVINPVFGKVGDNELFPDQKYLHYEHYKRVVDSNSVLIVTDRDQMLKAVSEALNQPVNRSAERKLICSEEVGAPLLQTSERFCDALKSIAHLVR